MIVGSQFSYWEKSYVFESFSNVNVMKLHPCTKLYNGVVLGTIIAWTWDVGGNGNGSGSGSGSGSGNISGKSGVGDGFS